MESELNQGRVDVSPWNSDSPPTTSSEAERGSADWECGAELEAAEALAVLAHSSGNRGWTEEELPIQRVNTKSSPGDSGTSPSSEASLEDQAVSVQQQCENMCSVVGIRMKVEQDAELHKPNPVCYASFNGGKSRPKLTESEKEARRIRRILSNRESARQTIRRRQAKYEELTRKAASLAQDNEKLKREKELAMKEYDSLKSTNEFFKAQMAKTLETDIEETPIDSSSANAEKIPTSAYTNCPFFINSQLPFTPFPWPMPTISQPSNPVQLRNGSQNVLLLSEAHIPSTANPDSFHEHQDPQNINFPGAPLYILPCPWFFPLPDHGNGLHLKPSFDLNDEQNGISMNSSFSSKSLALRPLLPMKGKTEASCSTETILVNDNISSVCPSDGGQNSGQGGIFMPSSLNLVGPTLAIKHDTGQQPQHLNSLPETKRDLNVGLSKKEEASLAAEARNKRKELMKLKRLHCC